MQNRMRPSAMGGYVMSPFGDYLSDILGLAKEVTSTVGDIAVAFRPPTATATHENAYQVPNQQLPYQQYQTPQVKSDNTLLYVAGGVALLAGAFVLSRR